MSVRGPAFPFRIENGRVQLATDEEKIRQNVRLILGTRLGERPMMREFGTRLPSLAHDPNDEVLTDIAFRQAAEALLRFEPRITVTSSRVERDADDGTVRLRLDYIHLAEQVGGQAIVPID